MQYLGATRCLLEDMQMANDKDCHKAIFMEKVPWCISIKDRLGEKIIVGRKLE